jgi:hypothetical protein
MAACAGCYLGTHVDYSVQHVAPVPGVRRTSAKSRALARLNRVAGEHGYTPAEYLTRLLDHECDHGGCVQES